MKQYASRRDPVLYAARQRHTIACLKSSLSRKRTSAPPDQHKWYVFIFFLCEDTCSAGNSVKEKEKCECFETKFIVKTQFLYEQGSSWSCVELVMMWCACALCHETDVDR